MPIILYESNLKPTFTPKVSSLYHFFNTNVFTKPVTVGNSYPQVLCFHLLQNREVSGLSRLKGGVDSLFTLSVFVFVLLFVFVFVFGLGYAFVFVFSPLKNKEEYGLRRPGGGVETDCLHSPYLLNTTNQPTTIYPSRKNNLLQSLPKKQHK